jgi:dodecin
VNVYRIIELVGVSKESWEDAAANAITTAARSMTQLRFGEVVAQEVAIDDQGRVTFRTKLSLLSGYEDAS